MNKISISASIPMRNTQYKPDILDNCRLSAKTFVLMKFPKYKDIALHINTSYSESLSQIEVSTTPVDYSINAELKHYLAHYIEHEENTYNKIKFDLSAILYVPKTWSFSAVGEYYDKIVERIQHTFPLVEIDDIRFVYVPTVRGNIITPVLKNTHHEMEQVMRTILFAVANSVYNEVSTNDTLRKHINSLGDI